MKQLKINANTTIEIEDDEDPKEAKKAYLKRVKEQRGFMSLTKEKKAKRKALRDEASKST